MKLPADFIFAVFAIRTGFESAPVQTATVFCGCLSVGFHNEPPHKATVHWRFVVCLAMRAFVPGQGRRPVQFSTAQTTVAKPHQKASAAGAISTSESLSQDTLDHCNATDDRDGAAIYTQCFGDFLLFSAGASAGSFGFHRFHRCCEVQRDFCQCFAIHLQPVKHYADGQGSWRNHGRSHLVQCLCYLDLTGEAVDCQIVLLHPSPATPCLKKVTSTHINS